MAFQVFVDAKGAFTAYCHMIWCRTTLREKNRETRRHVALNLITCMTLTFSFRHQRQKSIGLHAQILRVYTFKRGICVHRFCALPDPGSRPFLSSLFCAGGKYFAYWSLNIKIRHKVTRHNTIVRLLCKKKKVGLEWM